MKKLLDKDIHLRPLTFSVLVVAYSLVSWILFLQTSAGWAYVFYSIVAKWFFVAVAVIAIIIGMSTYLKKQVVVMSKMQIFLLIIFQLTYLLFNVGDCGDNPGSFTFLETLLKDPQYYCSYQTSSIIAPYVMIIGPLIYFILLLAIIISTIRNSHSVGTK